MIILLLVLSVSVKVYSIPNCGRTYFDKTSDFISSPNLANETCVYKIDVSAKSRWVLLEWTTFQFDATMPNCYDGDYVEVFTGCSSRKTLVSRFCSRNMKQLPHAIFALDGCMEIQMNARRSSLSNKFKASYTTFFRNQSLPSVFYSKCYSVQSIYSTVGVISSSGWPLFYRNNAFILSDCEWDIDTLNIKKVYKLNFMDMDLYNVGIFSDDVIIKGKAANAKNEWKYSRKNQLPFSLTTQYSSLKVKFDTSPLSQDNYRGFIVGFVAYDNVQTFISVSWKVVVGVVFAIVFLIACSIFCFRKYKKVKKVKKSSDKVLYGTIPTETYDSKTQPGYPLQQTNPQQPGYPPQQLGYPPQQPGYAPQQPGYPPQQSVYPPQYSAYPPQQPVYPPQQSEYPQQSAYPPLVKQN